LLAEDVVTACATGSVLVGLNIGVTLGADEGATALGSRMNVVNTDSGSEILEESDLVDGVITIVTDSLNSHITAEFANPIHGVASSVAKVIKVHFLEVKKTNLID